MYRALVVDDELSMRMTLSEFVRREGFECDVAEDAMEAFSMFKKNPYDLLITDIVMPKMTGIELMEKVREIDLDCKIIILTGEPTVETAMRAVQSQANDYLAKPVQKDEFIHIVRRNMQVKQLSDERKRLFLENERYQRHLEDMVAKRTRALQKSMSSTITLLSQVVEYRDPYTAGHQRRVGNCSAKIAEWMGLSTDLMESVRIMGYIHDIGKIVVPSEILSKPGKLSYPEFLLLQSHSLAGYEMLSDVNLPPIIAEGIYQHHERINGSGYPRKLKGDQISLQAHILMVADVVEAMTSHRPYRPSLGLDVALHEIESNAGILFDVSVSKACCELFRVGNYTFDDHQYEITMPV
jgi:putative two-component system response regulator